MAMERPKLLVVIIVLLLSLKSFATSPDSYLLFSITEESKARLGIVNKSRKTLRLAIYNDQNQMYFDKIVSGEENYFQMVDLSRLPNGEYLVRLDRGSGNSEERKFEVADGTATLLKALEERPPVFRVMGDNSSIIIAYSNGKNNKVNIFFEYNDEVVFEERNISGSPINKRYSISRLPKGDYVVKLYSGGKVYSYDMTLN